MSKLKAHYDQIDRNNGEGRWNSLKAQHRNGRHSGVEKGNPVHWMGHYECGFGSCQL